MRMLAVEVRRCLARRMVWLLVALAVAVCAVVSVVVWARVPQGEPFRYVELWKSRAEDPGLIGIPALFLVIGAVVGGASLVGAEWRAGALPMLATWEPRRVRVALAKVAAPGAVAAVIALALQLLFCLALLPGAIRWEGLGGADSAWVLDLVAAGVRIALMVGMAASFAAAVAMIGRNTAAGLAMAFGYLMVAENLVRAWKPWAGRFLVSTNGALVVTARDLTTEEFSRSTVTAAATLVAYVAVVTVAAVATFRRRDLASGV